MTRIETAAAASPGTAVAADEALCRLWYEAHGSAVYNYFRFLVRSPDDAEELTAETFLRVVRHASRYDESKASARTWILRIAQNMMRDQWRTERRRKHVSVDSLRDLAIDAPSSEERLVREEQVAQLLEGISELPEADQELISLRYSGGLDHREIASLLGIREAAVRTRLWRALARLREVVSDES
jgi:RNA polymerase sigma-70 factor (ECF subfamily)